MQGELHVHKGSGTGLAGSVLAGPLFHQINLFIFADIIFIKCIFGVHLLIILMEIVASIFTIRNYLQQVTDEKQVLLS